MKLLSISIDADFAKINQTVSEQMYSSTDNTLKVEKAFSINSERLNNLENSLSKDLTPFQTKRVMDVLRALSEDGTSNQTDAIVVCLHDVLYFFYPSIKIIHVFTGSAIYLCNASGVTHAQEEKRSKYGQLEQKYTSLIIF